jgi:hypothetical protein
MPVEERLGMTHDPRIFHPMHARPGSNIPGKYPGKTEWRFCHYLPVLLGESELICHKGAHDMSPCFSPFPSIFPAVANSDNPNDNFLAVN